MAIPEVLLFMGSQLDASSSRDMEGKKARVAIIVGCYIPEHARA